MKRLSTMIACSLAALCAGLAAWRTADAGPGATVLFLSGSGQVRSAHFEGGKVPFTCRLDFDSGFTLQPGRGPAITGTISEGESPSERILTPVAEDEDLLAFVVQLHRDAKRTDGGPELPELALQEATFTLDLSDGPGDATLRVAVEFSESVPAKPVPALRLEAPASERPFRIVVLDDGFSAPQVLKALAKARLPAAEVGFYQTWDGTNPSLEGVDAVILLQGYEYDADMTSNGDAALASFVQGGGVVVRSEWSAFEIGASPALDVDQLHPVRAPGQKYDYDTANWSRIARHPVTAGLPKKFRAASNHGFSVATPVDGAQVLMSLTGGEDEDNGGLPYTDVPAVAILESGSGATVWINHDLSYSTFVIPKAVLKLITNAAKWAGKRAAE